MASLNGKGDVVMNCEVVVDTKDLSYEDWLKYRKIGLGGSDIAAVFGTSQYKTKKDLYFEKTGLMSVVNKNNNGWVQKEFGKLLEPLVAKLFSAKTGFTIFKDTNMYRHKINRFMTANVDYFIEFQDGSIGILECKTCSYYSTSKWDCDEIPFEYELQTRHYMAVMDIERAYIACLYDNNENSLIIREIIRDREFERVIIEEEHSFWTEYIEKNIEPPYIEDGSLCLLSHKKYDYNIRYDNEVELPKKSLSHILEYLKLEEEKKRLNGEIKEINSLINKQKVCLLQTMNNNKSAIIKDDENTTYLVKNTLSQRNDIDKEKLSHQYPDIYNRFKKVSTTERFSIKKIKKKIG